MERQHRITTVFVTAHEGVHIVARRLAGMLIPAVRIATTRYGIARCPVMNRQVERYERVTTRYAA